MKGKIKRWLEDKNFGFIDIGEEKDLFFHRNELAEGYMPQEGDEVEFEKQQGDKGPMAVKVKKAEATEEAAPVAEETTEKVEEEAPVETPAKEPVEETTEKVEEETKEE